MASALPEGRESLSIDGHPASSENVARHENANYVGFMGTANKDGLAAGLVDQPFRFPEHKPRALAPGWLLLAVDRVVADAFQYTPRPV